MPPRPDPRIRAIIDSRLQEPAEPIERADWEGPIDIPDSAVGEPDYTPMNGATTAPTEIQPFKTFDASQWEGVPIEPRRWIAENRIPVGEPGIMSGDGGTGKTKLALQLAVSIAAGLQDWIGGIVEADGPVIVFSAEEKLKEMHRRTLDILDHRRLSFADLRGALHFICDQDQTVLGAVDRNGVVQPTTSLLRLEKTVAAIRPALVIVENAADVYSGLNDGTGRSGSTGWNNSGRWRLNFTKAKDSDELRQLEIAKNNYGPTGEKITLRWERGVFVPESQADASPYRAAAEREIDDCFLRLLDKRNAQARHVRPSKGPGYAPSEFAADPEAGAITARAFAAAMERLYSAGIIKTVETGPASRRFRHVERAIP
jgi:RecA-family ATPase